MPHPSFLDRAAPSVLVVARRLADFASMELVDDSSLDELLRRIVDVTSELLPAHGASIVLWDPERGDFTIGASNIPGQDEIASSRWVRREGGATRWIVENREAVVVSDIAADPFRGNPLPGRFGVQSWAGVPILSDGVARGVLYVLDMETRRYDDHDVSFLHLVARRAATAIASAEIMGQSRAARERSEALAWVANALIAADGLREVLGSVVEGVTAALLAARVTLVTVDRGHTRILDHVGGGWQRDGVAPPSFEEFLEGLGGWVLREGRVAISAQLPVDERVSAEQRAEAGAAGLGPAVAAALRFGDRVLGTLMAVRRAGDEPFSDAEVDLVIAMASQAAVAIENVRLIEATRSALRESEALFSLSQALAGAGDMAELLEVVADGAAGLLPADAVEVHVLGDDAHEPSTVVAGACVDRFPSPIVPVDGPDWGRVMRGRSAVAIGGGMHGVTAPLRVHERMIGYIAAANLPGNEPFTSRQTELLMTLAAHGASAIDSVSLFARVQLLAVTDELTGAHNRRHLFELAEQEFAQARRYMRPLSALMFDLDRFKDINDTYGHAIGDQVLRWVADHCRDVVREVDVWGRYGGEEFAVLLPETELKGAVAVAERLREQVAAQPLDTGRGPVVVTISLGVAELGDEMADVHALIDRADAAMYFAKRTGRNRVESA